MNLCPSLSPRKQTFTFLHATHFLNTPLFAPPQKKKTEHMAHAQGQGFSNFWQPVVPLTVLRKNLRTPQIFILVIIQQEVPALLLDRWHSKSAYV